MLLSELSVFDGSDSGFDSDFEGSLIAGFSLGLFVDEFSVGISGFSLDREGELLATCFLSTTGSFASSADLRLLSTV